TPTAPAPTRRCAKKGKAPTSRKDWIGAALTAGLAASAHAQIGNMDGPYFGTFPTGGSAGNMVNMNRDSVGGLVNSTMGLQYFGDWSWAMPRNDSTATIDSYSVIKFGVGPLPVRVSNFSFGF